MKLSDLRESGEWGVALVLAVLMALALPGMAAWAQQDVAEAGVGGPRVGRA